MRARPNDSLPSDASPYLDEGAFYIDRLEEAGPYGNEEMSGRVETPWLSNEVLTDPVAEEEAWSGAGEQVEFRNRVLSAHLERSKRRSGASKRDLGPDELRNVRGTDIAMRADAADAASRLLEAVNQALAEAKNSGNADALRTIRITANSGYRGRDHQQRLWLKYFPKYYKRTRAAREAMDAGPHSNEAVTYMLETFGIPRKIAAPGYSNHQAGIAIDIHQERARGHDISNSTDAAWRKKWRGTWAHKWLRDHAATFGFVPYKKEEWHWEFKPAAASKLQAGESFDDTESEIEMQEHFDAVSELADDFVDSVDQGEEETAHAGKSSDTFLAKAVPVKVALLITRAARQARQVEVLFYVHGLDVCGRGGGERPMAFITAEPFELGDLVEKSGRPIVLVVPYLDWKIGQKWRTLAKPGILNGVIAEVLERVGALSGTGSAPALSRLILAGHSRAYAFFDALAAARDDLQMSKGALGRLSHVWALDTTYRSSDKAWMAWLRSRDDLRMTVIYRDATYEDPATKVKKRVPTGLHGERFLGLAPKSNGQLSATKVVAGKVRHCNIPKAYLPDLLDSLPAVSAKAEEELDFESFDNQSEEFLAEAESLDDEAMPDQYLETEAWDDEVDDLEATGEEEGPLESFAAFADSTNVEEEEEEEESQWVGDEETEGQDLSPDEEAYGEDEVMEAEVLEASGLTPAELKAVQITSTFETGKRGGFFGLTGNFDGQGISFGLVNWNIGTGSLQPLLREFAGQEPARWRAVFGPHAATFSALITPEGKTANAAQLRFVIDEMNVSRIVDGKRKWSVKEPWVTYFTRLSEDPAFQRIQVRAVRELLDRGRYYCELFGLKSERAFTFMFDAVSSHGKWWLMKKWDGVEKRRALYASRLKTLEATHGKGSVPEREVLLILADILAETSSERWKTNVRERKRWFVTGEHPRAKELKGLEPRADAPYLTSVPTGPRPTTGAATTTKELVRFAQIALNAAEGERLSDDGDLGPATRAALERFRARYGLSSANVLDGRVQTALAQKAIEAITRTSRFATIGERDARTLKEIRSFQLANGVSASGDLDAATRAAFVAALSRPSKPSATSGTNFYEQTIRKHPLFDSSKRIADLELLEPVTRERVRAIIRDAADQGIKLMVWETYRSKARQEELFKRGTTKLRTVGVHHYGLACDLVKNVNGEPSWKGDFKFMEALARSNKLVWGGDWGIAGKKPSFYDPVHVQRCSLSRQKSLFNGIWYPDEAYDPYTS